MKVDVENESSEFENDFKIVIIFLNESRDVSGKGDLELAPGLSIEARKGKVVVFPSSWMYAFDDTPFKNIDKYVVYFLLD